VRRAPRPPPSSRVAVAAMLAIAAVIALLAVVHVARRQQVLRLGYELSEAAADLRARQEDNRRLRLEQSVLTSPERIERLARSMGLVRPSPEQLRVAPVTPAQAFALAAEERRERPGPQDGAPR
jgi:cell division protein FtsL